MSRIVAIGIVLLLIGYSVQQSNRTDAPSTTQRAEDAVDKKPDPPKKTDAECRLDLQCWAEHNLAAASVRCDGPIERLSKFQAEWTNSWLEQKFSRYNWRDQSRGTLIFFGDKIKFQTGFGGWQPHTYSCVYDPTTKTVLSVTARAGRLSD